ncbi:MAG: HEPN domain-containing protein [Candidatus Nanoarchaeia archaeon]|nr:HEPN domain-containing protein [Candidatus Nanoarchaeia archaeon]MDD5587588.1 HEPN domain-containing protein [Candidatus Nanoarchaeia archaeon]
MDSMVEIFMDRSNNEISIAESLKKLSEDNKLKEEFKIPENMTFYSSVISHSYYAIFYAAKAILLTKGIKTSSPEVHKKTFEEFKINLIDNGLLDVKLLKIYKEMVVKADELLEIFKVEKGKRGDFTYKTIPQANKGPAEESLRNSKFFVSNILKIIQN